MGEPLKNKVIIIDIDDLNIYLNELKEKLDIKKYPLLYHYALYSGIDVKSAVEWLKEQQYKELCRLQETNEGNFEKVLTLINEAFPDLNPIGSDNTRKNPEQSDYDYMI